MRKAGVSEPALCEAMVEMRRGLIDADLGGGVVKKRVPLPGRGKSGGARTLVATNRDDRWFFLYGFAKNDRDSVRADESEALQNLAADLLRLSRADLDAWVEAGALHEICDDTETEDEEPDSRSGARDRR
jgi:hypothetical protein